jgi:hypothetical protein
LTDPSPDRAAPPAGRIVGGALLGGVISLALGYGLDLAGVLRGDAGWGRGYRVWLAAGGWTWLPLFGAALGAWTAARRMPAGGPRLRTRALALALALLPAVWRAAVPEGGEDAIPDSREGKIRVIRRLSYRSTETVARLLPLSRDADPIVRARATLALGVNRIVTDIEHDRPGFPSRHAAHPLRDSLRLRLLEALRDPEEEVRIEAARALWKAPRTFGAQPSAAETLAHALDRYGARPTPGRLAWLALDAAAGAPDSTLRAATRRFAAATPDTVLARVARGAASGHAPSAAGAAGP